MLGRQTKVPDANGAVVGSRDDARLGEVDAGDGVLVRLKRELRGLDGFCGQGEGDVLVPFADLVRAHTCAPAHVSTTPHCGRARALPFLAPARSVRTMIRPSCEPDTMCSVLNLTHHTPSMWPKRVATCLPLATSHTIRERSRDPDTRTCGDACARSRSKISSARANDRTGGNGLARLRPRSARPLAQPALHSARPRERPHIACAQDYALRSAQVKERQRHHF